MNFGVSDKDQTKVKEAVSSLWGVCNNIWDNIVNDKSEEKIKELEEKVQQLKEKWKEGKSLDE